MRRVERLFSASSRGGEYVLKRCVLLIDLCCVSSHPLPPSDHVRVRRARGSEPEPMTRACVKQALRMCRSCASAPEGERGAGRERGGVSRELTVE